MTDEEQFQNELRAALHEVSEATPPSADLAERLIANAEQGGAGKVVRLRPHRRMVMPLLAAAACIVVVAGIVLGTRFFAADQHNPPPATVQPAPIPSEMASTAHTTTARSDASAGTDNTKGASSESTGATKGADDEPAWLSELRASTGAPGDFHGAAVEFLDTENGWVLGDAACATEDTSSCPALIRTADGGKTWKSLTVPAGLSSATVGNSCAPNASVNASPCVNQVTSRTIRLVICGAGPGCS